MLSAPRIIVFAVMRWFALVWTAVAVANVVSPRWASGLTARWKAVGEPAPAYFLVRRIVAIVMLVMALGFFGLGILGG